MPPAGFTVGTRTGCFGTGAPGTIWHSLAVLALLPVLAWTLFEFRAAGHAVAGTIFVLAVSCSAFVLDLLSLGYSAAGVHLVGLLTLVPLATYAVLGQPTVRGLLFRAGIAGCLLGPCVLCRGTGLLFLPGFALALAIGATRVSFATHAILPPGLMATVSLHKLWPWARRDGTSIVPASSPNEGVTDNYYLMTAQADWLTLGRWTGEAPIALLLAPTLLLLAAASVPVAWTRLGPLAARARQALPLLACVALAALPTPVFITTATAFETECFVVVHFLALAFMAEGFLSRGPNRTWAAPPGVA